MANGNGKKNGNGNSNGKKELTDFELMICHARVENPTWSNARCYRVARPNYKTTSLASLAYRFFGKPHIQEYIKEMRKKIRDEVEIKVQDVLFGLMQIIDFNPQNLLDEDGNPKPLKDLDPEDAKLLEGVKLRYIKIKKTNGDEAIEAYIEKYKTSKLSSVYELLGKYLKMWTDKIELPDLKDLPDRIFKIHLMESGEKKE